MDRITAADMNLLLETLSEHYATGMGELNQAELDSYASDALITLFDKLDIYYTVGEGTEVNEAKDIWILIDYLAEFFGQKSDYEVDEDALHTLYEEFKSEKPLEKSYFEGNKISSYEDLVDLQENQKEDKIN